MSAKDDEIARLRRLVMVEAVQWAHKLNDMEARAEAAERERDKLRVALEPFASHIGKDGETVVLKIGKDTWTDTLTTKHFDAARATLEAKP